MEARTHYEVLGVAPEATAEEIRAAWVEKVKKCHPDRLGWRGENIDQVNFAYSTLKDPERRRQYDATLALLPGLEKPRCTQCKGSGKVYVQVGWTRRDAKVCNKCGGMGYATT